jgi:cold shock protein
VAVKGRVIRFDEFRGYGFVAPEQGGEDVFIHVNDVEFDKRLITPGVVVEFQVEDGDRGLKASRVQLLDGGAPPQAPPAAASSPAAEPVSSDEEGLCDVLSAKEFGHEITESLLVGVPGMTGGQIVLVRQLLTRIAREHGWLEG